MKRETPMEITVTQTDIDKAVPGDSAQNCVALAIKRVKHRDDVMVFPYVGAIRIGNRKYDLDDDAAHYLIVHMRHYKIRPFTFDLPGKWTMTR